MGRIRAARRAGIKPANVPVMINRTKACTAMLMLTSGSRNMGPPGSIREMLSNVAIPSNNPPYPASAVTTNASNITCVITLPGVAPKALRIPISLVRSFTTMSMMLLTPMIPAMMVPMPMIQMKVLIAVKTPVNWM